MANSSYMDTLIKVKILDCQNLNIIQKEKMKNKDLIKNYYDQLAELQKKFWFERLDLKEYCVRYDAINKRIEELENG